MFDGEIEVEASSETVGILSPLKDMGDELPTLPLEPVELMEEPQEGEEGSEGEATAEEDEDTQDSGLMKQSSEEPESLGESLTDVEPTDTVEPEDEEEEEV